MIMAALALPPRPTRAQVRAGLAGNLCRCTGYEAIYRAIAKASEESAVSQQPSGVGRQPSANSHQPSSDSRGPLA
jgi:xanthine dehydrogenase iron-sulfur cluster and FAD-binding subunit A